MQDSQPAESGATPLAREQSELIRVRLAAERTLLAWIRTGLALMGFGFLVARFGLFMREIAAVPDRSIEPAPSLWLGTALVLLGVIVNLLAAGQHHQFLRRFALDRVRAAGRASLGLAVALVLAVLGLAMATYLISMG